MEKIFVKKLLDNGHEAMIEHVSASYRVICDRGVTHEIVRHRLFSYAQESTRYCNYKSGVTFIIPPWMTIEEQEVTWDKPYGTSEVAQQCWMMQMIQMIQMIQIKQMIK